LRNLGVTKNETMISRSIVDSSADEDSDLDNRPVVAGIFGRNTPHIEAMTLSERVDYRGRSAITRRK
jgi:hypothetical protein